MEALFPAMMQTLTEASKKLDNGELDNVRMDTLNFLHARILQLNGVLKFEHDFTNRLIPDIIDYAYLLQENEQACKEFIEFQFYRPTMFGEEDAYTKYEALFLQEVIQGIIDNSNDIIHPPA
ncbi:hypothetical protein ACQ33O_12765 [Ferruginibacter sp. SUN002]|uniref:hypothetical protein n=1 Tax=Ferruginibacter sp. SUN002 TaxID=2937789 RepID=UPI003D369B0F